MNIFLGLDSSTQGLKAEIVDLDSASVLFRCSVNYGNDLPEFESDNGYLQSAGPLIKHANPLMWAAALDLLFERLQNQRAPLDKVAGISGSGQQHGTVYLKSNFPEVLTNLDKDKKLSEQLAPTLAYKK